MRTKLSQHLRRLLGALPGAQKTEPAPPTAAPEPLTDTELRVQ